MIFKHYLRTDKLSAEILDELLVYSAVATIIGAWLGHCLFYEPDFYLKTPLEILKIWKGGLAGHGAAITVPFALWIYIRKYKLSFLWLIDRIFFAGTLPLELHLCRKVCFHQTLAL